jgi:hypothetical protein
MKPGAIPSAQRIGAQRASPQVPGYACLLRYSQHKI